ncbi:MAG: hypothetical protein ACLVHV_01630 [Oscillospiraceae bacterium]
MLHRRRQGNWTLLWSNPQGYFTQTSPWGKVKEDWLWRGILCREETGRIRGAMAVLMRRVRWIGCRMLYAPRGPVADPEDLETLALLVRGAKEMGEGISRVFAADRPSGAGVRRGFPPEDGEIGLSD